VRVLFQPVINVFLMTLLLFSSSSCLDVKVFDLQTIYRNCVCVYIYACVHTRTQTSSVIILRYYFEGLINDLLTVNVTTRGYCGKV